MIFRKAYIIKVSIYVKILEGKEPINLNNQKDIYLDEFNSIEN